MNAPGMPTKKESEAQNKDQRPYYTSVRLKPHPLADLLPPMSFRETVELRRDIAEHGVLEPVILFEGKILDGRSRHAACRELRIETPTVKYRGKHPREFVLSMNLHRRHLSQEQKRELVKMMLMDKPEASDRAIAKKVKASHVTVAKVRKKAEAGGQIEHHEKRVGTDGKAQPSTRARRAEAAPEADLVKRLRVLLAALGDRELRECDLDELLAAVDIGIIQRILDIVPHGVELLLRTTHAARAEASRRAQIGTPCTASVH